MRRSVNASAPTKSFITDPVGKAKSVAFTQEGLRESQRLFETLFAR